MTVSPDGVRAKNSAQTVERAFALLSCFAVDATEWSIANLAQRTGLTHSTAYRLLTTLESAGLVERTGGGNSYRLGLQTAVLAYVALLDNRVRQFSLPAITEMATTTGLRANVGCLHHGQVMYLGRSSIDPDPRAGAVIGRLAPLYGTGMGKAMLAFMPPEMVDQLVEGTVLKPFTPTTITTMSDLRADLAEARERGYAIDCGEWSDEGWCVAAPLRGNGGTVLGALSLTGSKHQFGEAKIIEYGHLVMRYAARTSYDLGYIQGYT